MCQCKLKIQLNDQKRIEGVYGLQQRKDENKPQEQNTIQADNFLIAEKMKIDLKIKIQSVLENIKEFWHKLLEGYPDLEVYMKQVLILITEILKTKTCITKNLEQFRDSPSFIKLNILFSAFVENNIIDGFIYEKKLKSYIEKDTIQRKDAVNTLLTIKKQITSIIASFLKDWGQIVMTSAASAQIFNYQIAEFQILNNISQLMPQKIAENHNKFIQRLLRYGQSHQIQKYRQIYFLCKQGFIFSGKLNINYFFAFPQDFCFQTLVIKLVNNHSHILTDKNGFIQNFDLNFLFFNSTEAQQDAKQIENAAKDFRRSHISVMIPEFFQMVSKFNAQKEKKSWSETVNLTHLRYNSFSEILILFKFQLNRLIQVFQTVNIDKKLTRDNLDFNQIREICQEFFNLQINIGQDPYLPECIHSIRTQITKEYHSFDWINEDLEIFFFEIKEVTLSNAINQQFNYNLLCKNINKAVQQNDQCNPKQFQTTVHDLFNQSILDQSQKSEISQSSNSFSVTNSGQQMIQSNNDKTSALSKCSSMDFMNSDSNYNYLSQILAQLKVPIVVKTLYFFYMITIITFVFLLIYYLEITMRFIERYNQNYKLLITKQQIIIPQNQLYSYIQYQVIQNNLNITIPIEHQLFINNQLQYYSVQFQDYLYLIYNLDQSLNSSKVVNLLVYDAQQLFKGTENQYQMQFLEFTKITLYQILELKEKIIDISSFDNEKMYFILKNYPGFINYFSNYFEEIDLEIQLLFQNFYLLNSSSLILVIFVVVFSLVLNIPAYLSYKSKLQRLLMIMTRISPRDAEAQILTMNHILGLINEPDEPYIDAPFNRNILSKEPRSSTTDISRSNAEQRQSKISDDNTRSSKIPNKDNLKNKRTQIKKQLLQSKIQIQSLNTINFIILILIIALFSCTFFFGIYLGNQQLFKQYENQLPLNTKFYNNAFYLSEVLQIDQTLLYIQILQQKNEPQPKFIKNNQQQQLELIKNNRIAQIKQFYFDQYINILIEQNTNLKIKELLQDVNQNNICSTLDFDQVRIFGFKKYCETIKNEILTRGIQPTIHQQIFQIENKPSNLIEYVETDQLFNQLQVNEYLLSSLQKNSKIINELNISNSNNNLILFISILSVSVIFKFSIFYLFFQFYFKKLESDYLKIFKSLRLIPFSKFGDDTIKNLIKKSVV